MLRISFLALVFVAVLMPVAVVKGDAPKATDLEGVWVPAKAILDGKPFPDQLRKTIRLEIKGDDYTVLAGGNTDRGTCKLDTSTDPKSIDITGTDGPNKGVTMLAIYERNGDTLKVCYDMGGKKRPKEFKSEKGSKTFFVEYKLQKP